MNESLIRCITIHQPYPALIFSMDEELPQGAHSKLVENRDWRTHHRGPLLIHAGTSLQWFRCGDWPGIDVATRKHKPDFPYGCIVGIVDLVDCVNLSQVRNNVSHEHHWIVDHPHASGSFCWILDNVRRFRESIQFTGKQGLFTVRESLVSEAIESAEFIRNLSAVTAI